MKPYTCECGHSFDRPKILNGEEVCPNPECHSVNDWGFLNPTAEETFSLHADSSELRELFKGFKEDFSPVN